MTFGDAKKAENELREFCKEKGLWFENLDVNKPELSLIEFKITIKVDK